MPAPNLPKIVDAAYIADTLALEAEMFRGLLRSGCLTPSETSRLAEELGRFCLEAAAAVTSEAANGAETYPSKYDEGSGRLPAETLFWD
jgi:hypothetical protein